MHISLSANVGAVIAEVVVCSVKGGSMLNKEQISFFKANGYLLLPSVMDLDLCAPVRDTTKQTLCDKRCWQIFGLRIWIGFVPLMPKAICGGTGPKRYKVLS